MAELDDLNCSICFTVFFQPVTTPLCQHTFCKSCLEKVLEQKNSCPLCRQTFPTDFKIENTIENESISEQVKQRFPQEYLERENEWKREQEELKNFIIKRLKIGNDHRALQNRSQNSHKWGFYLRDFEGDAEEYGLTKLVEKIEVHLHPTFNPSKIVLKNPPFLVERLGWGTFSIQWKMFFYPHLNQEPISGSHDLSFHQNGAFSVVKIRIDKRLIQDIARVIEPEEESPIAARARHLSNLLAGDEN